MVEPYWSHQCDSKWAATRRAPIRLPTGCKAAVLQPDAFKTMLLEIYKKAQLGEAQEHAIQRLFANLFDPREAAGAASASDASMAGSDY